MHTPAIQTWFLSHTVANYAIVASREGIVRIWQTIDKEMVCTRQQPKNEFPFSHIVANSALIVNRKGILKTW